MEKKGINIAHLIAIFISVFFTLIFFLSRDLLSEKEYLFIDHGFNLGLFECFGEYIAFQYFSTYGPLPHIYSGTYYFPLYPMGSCCVYFFHLFGLSYSWSYKLFLFLSLFWVGYFPFYFSKRLGLKDYSAIFTQIWFWIGMESYFLIMFSTGSYQYHIASTFTLLFLFNIYKPVEFKDEKDKVAFLCNNILLLLISVSFNYLTGLFILIFVSIRILFCIIKNRGITKQFVEYIYYLLIICIITILIFSFWLFPTIFYHLAGVKQQTEYFLFSKDFTIGVNLWYLSINKIDILVGLFILILLKYLDRNKKFEAFDFIFYLLVVSFIFIFFLVYTNILLFVGVNAFRNICFFEMSMALIMGYASEYVTFSLFEKIKFYRSVKAKFTINSSAKLSIVLLFLLLFSFADIVPAFSNGHNFLNPLIYDGKTAKGWEEDEQSLMEWIEDNTNLSSRILIELSGDFSGFKMSGGHNILYFSLKTNRYFSVGFSHHYIYSYHDLLTYIDGVLYGKNILDYEFNEFYNYSVYYNFKYVICWSNQSWTKFQKFSDTCNNFSFIEEVGSYGIFEIVNSTNSYIINHDQGIISNFSYVKDEIRFRYTSTESNPEKTSYLIISIHDYPNWNVYINNRKVLKSKNDLKLIQFNLPPIESGVFDISIRWELTGLEIISNLISMGGGLVFIIVKWRNKTIQQIDQLFKTLIKKIQIYLKNY